MRRIRRRSRCPKTSRLRQARRSIGSPVIGAGPARNGLGLRAITSNGPTKLRSGSPVIGSRVAMAISGLMDVGDKSAVEFETTTSPTIDTLWQALLPAGLYLAFHLIEGEIVTPMLLARRFTLNPVVGIIARLLFW